MGLPKIKLAGGGERFQFLVHEYNDNTPVCAELSRHTGRGCPAGSS